MSAKRYKATTKKRREETRELEEEARRLQAELERLQPHVAVDKVASENALLGRVIRRQQLGVASEQSALTAAHSIFLNQSGIRPLHSPFFLAKNWNKRKELLLSIRERKLQDAYEFVSLRSQVTEGNQARLSDERSELNNGDTCCTIFQSLPLPGVKSIKQAYEAVLYAFDHAEISISERLGHVTVRDDYDYVDSKIYNARIVSTSDLGVDTELNCAVFSRLCEGDKSFGDSACGMVVLDTVDGDELYPYTPTTRVRKDVSAAFVVTKGAFQTKGQTSESEEERWGGSGVEQDERCVTLHRAAFIKLHYPEFSISDAAWQEIQHDTPRWGEVMVQCIRSVLYGGTVELPSSQTRDGTD